MIRYLWHCCKTPGPAQRGRASVERPADSGRATYRTTNIRVP